MFDVNAWVDMDGNRLTCRSNMYQVPSWHNYTIPYKVLGPEWCNLTLEHLRTHAYVEDDLPSLQVFRIDPVTLVTITLNSSALCGTAAKGLSILSRRHVVARAGTPPK